MVTRLFYGSPIDEDISRLTAEDVPNHELDMSEALNFADQVRSKEHSAKEAARALRKRLSFSNPNVQILTLTLADICMKNGGSLIQLELSNREYVEEMAGLLDSRTGREYELRQLVLKLIQEWAHMFKGDSEKGYVSGVYERMKRTGYSFPRVDVVSSGAMADTASAPEWEDSPVCQRCRTQFSLTNRKHHCRHCGKCVCNDCSSNQAPIPKFAIYEPVRVCHGCYLRLKNIVADIEDPSGNSSHRATSSFSGNESGGRHSSRSGRHSHSPRRMSKTRHSTNGDDEDLKRAIELSLKEAQQKPNYADFTLRDDVASPSASIQATVSAASPATVTKASTTNYPVINSRNEPYPLTSAPKDYLDNTNGGGDEDDDADLRAAIEASLKDMPESKTSVPDYLATSSSANNYPSTQTRNQYSSISYGNPNFREGPAIATKEEVDQDDAPLSAFMPPADVDEEEGNGPLNTTEMENLKLFDALLVRDRDSGQDVQQDPQVQYLHETVGQIRPKITEAIDSADHKHKEFVKLHDRIVTAIKIYDQLLDKRLRSSTLNSGSNNNQNRLSYMPPPPPLSSFISQQPMYPAVPPQQTSYTPSVVSQSPYPPGNQQKPTASVVCNMPPSQSYFPQEHQQQPPPQSMPPVSQGYQQPVPISQEYQQPQHNYSSQTGQSSYIYPTGGESNGVPQQQQQPTLTRAPAANSNYSQPPPASSSVWHVPNIPVLQPFNTKLPSQPELAPVSAPTNKTEPAEPVEEAPLIEF